MAVSFLLCVFGSYRMAPLRPWNNQGRVRIGEVNYEVNTSNIEWKESVGTSLNIGLFSSYGGSIYFVIYFTNSDTVQNISSIWGVSELAKYITKQRLPFAKVTYRVLKSLCDREYVWEHGNMTENFSDECALREFMRI